jgi:urea transporter
MLTPSLLIALLAMAATAILAAPIGDTVETNADSANQGLDGLSAVFSSPESKAVRYRLVIS